MPAFRSSSIRAVLVVSFAALVLAGCECFPCDEAPQAQLLWPYIQMAPTPPPDPLHENITIPSEPSAYLWRPGYWTYNGISFDWNQGQMILRPSPTAVWAQDHWIEHTYGWVFIPGYWQ